MSRCRGVQSLIVRAVEGELEPRDALRLAQHIGGCTSCRIVLARERRLADALDGLGDLVNVDSSFFDAVMASLPEGQAVPAGRATHRDRWRRGLRLAGLTLLAIAGGGLAAQFLPFLRLDLVAPAMPRFAPDDDLGWLTLFGSAAQWVRVTAETLSWSAPVGVFGREPALTMGVEALLVSAAVALLTSAAVALRRPERSSAS